MTPRRAPSKDLRQEARALTTREPTRQASLASFTITKLSLSLLRERERARARASVKKCIPERVVQEYPKKGIPERMVQEYPKKGIYCRNKIAIRPLHPLPK
jgi:hypothetical protein